MDVWMDDKQIIVIITTFCSVVSADAITSTITFTTTSTNDNTSTVTGLYHHDH